jgi:hypothetical protein
MGGCIQYFAGLYKEKIGSTDKRTGLSAQRNTSSLALYSIAGGLDHTDLGPKAALVKNRSKRSSTPNQLIFKFKLSPLSLHIIVNTFRPRDASYDTKAGTESRGSGGFDTWFLGEVVKHLD